MMQDWLKVGFGLWLLGGEMAMVIVLRGMKLAAGGPAAAAESHRMIAEKIAAGFALQARAWSGRLGSTTPAVIDRSTRYYHRRVRANRRRLSKL
jgi:hypothetical protein